MPNFSNLTAVLADMTKKTFSWDKTTWTKDYEGEMKKLKEAVVNSQTVHFPDHSLPWVLRTDASDVAVGGTLLQQLPDLVDGKPVYQVIAFVSQKFSGAAVRWDTLKKEAYAIFFSVKALAYYLHGKFFVIETDHANLIWMEKSEVHIIIRWRMFLQGFWFMLRHIPGKANVMADMLSRMYIMSSYKGWRWQRKQGRYSKRAARRGAPSVSFRSHVFVTDVVPMPTVAPVPTRDPVPNYDSDVEEEDDDGEEDPTLPELVMDDEDDYEEYELIWDDKDEERRYNLDFPDLLPLEWNTLFLGATEYAGVMPSAEECLTAAHVFNRRHCSARVTRHNLNELFPGHRIHYNLVRNYVEECPVCQKNSRGMAPTDVIRPVIYNLKPPHHRSVVGVDTFLVSPPDKLGHVCIHVVVNHFTSFVFLFPAKDNSARSMAARCSSSSSRMVATTRLCLTPGPTLLRALRRSLSPFSPWLGSTRRVESKGPTLLSTGTCVLSARTRTSETAGVRTTLRA